MERGAMAGSVDAIPGRNSAFETGGVQASDGPEHAVSWMSDASYTITSGIRELLWHGMGPKPRYCAASRWNYQIHHVPLTKTAVVVVLGSDVWV